LIPARALACLAIAGAVLGASPAAQQVRIPAEYRGEWTNEPRYCGFEGDDMDSRLTVTATEVGYYANNWRVKSIERTPAGLRIAYYPRTDFDMYAPNFLRLSRTGKRIYTSEDPVDTGYKRCPKGRK
jgi:hypothetical protein